MAEKAVIPPKRFSVIFALLALEGLGCLIALLLIPADPSSSVLFGYSAARLAMAAAIAIGIAALVTGSVLVARNKRITATVAGMLNAAPAFYLLLAGSMLGSALCINWPFAAPELQATYARAFPMLLFVTLVLLHLLALGLWPEKRAGQRKLALVAFGGILFISYLVTSFHYSQVNREYWLSDQQAMLSLTRQMKDSGYAFTGTRDFMPGFPLLASPLMDTRLEDAALFAQGKAINIALSLIFVAGIFFVARRYFNIYQAALFAALAAFTLFIYKAPYYQPELTYYFFSFVAFVLMLELFAKPRWPVAVLTGLLLAAAHHTKASVLPLVALFAVVMAAQAVYVWLTQKHDWRKAGRYVAVLAITLLAFLLPLAPYLAESKANYGSYFYNVNSSYYLWFDSWGEAKASNEVFEYALGQPDAARGELPSLAKYLREHSAGDIASRFGAGFANQAANWFNTFALVSFPLLFLLALVAVALRQWPRTWEKIKARPIVPLFVVGFFAGYTTLFAWYGPIADYADRRFTYGLYLPLLFCAFMGLNALPPAKKRRDWRPVIFGGAAALLAADLLLHLPYQFLVFQWFGK